MRWLICLTILAGSFTTASSLQAQGEQRLFLRPVYKVEVEYWFFDTTGYYWSTKLETEDQALANSYYQALLVAKAAGQLNSVVPNSYWRYIAVDVRMRVCYRPIVQLLYITPYRTAPLYGNLKRVK